MTRSKFDEVFVSRYRQELEKRSSTFINKLNNISNTNNSKVDVTIVDGENVIHKLSNTPNTNDASVIQTIVSTIQSIVKQKIQNIPKQNTKLNYILHIDFIRNIRENDIRSIIETIYTWDFYSKDVKQILKKQNINLVLNINCSFLNANLSDYRISGNGTLITLNNIIENKIKKKKQYHHLKSHDDLLILKKIIAYDLILGQRDVEIDYDIHIVSSDTFSDIDDYMTSIKVEDYKFAVKMFQEYVVDDLFYSFYNDKIKSKPEEAFFLDLLTPYDHNIENNLSNKGFNYFEVNTSSYSDELMLNTWGILRSYLQPHKSNRIGKRKRKLHTNYYKNKKIKSIGGANFYQNLYRKYKAKYITLLRISQKD